MMHVGEIGISILKDHRGVGIGTAMMDFLVKWAREKGLEKLSLSTFSTNVRAINLFKKFGFEIEGVKKKQFKIRGEYADEVIMGMLL
jgi:RimJ/RimL family protein N-acetyltransferase